MKEFLGALCVLLVTGFGASIILEGYQKTVDSAYVGAGARPDPEPTLRGGKG